MTTAQASTVVRQFINVYQQYRRAGHRRSYCVRIAYSVAVNRTPF